MSAGVNKVILVGNLGNDPELRYTGAGTPVCNFRVATNEQWYDKEGQKQERTEWHRIVTWAGLAENCGQYLEKGRQVYIEGKMQTRQWEDREGNKRYTTEVVALNVQFLGKRPQGERQEEDTGSHQSSDTRKRPSDLQEDDGRDGGYEYGPPPMTDDDVPF